MADGSIQTLLQNFDHRTSNNRNAYFELLTQLGALSTPHSSHEVEEKVRTLTHALHHVLAGGNVDVNIVAPGFSGLVTQLDSTFQTELVASLLPRRLGPLAM